MTRNIYVLLSICAMMFSFNFTNAATTMNVKDEEAKYNKITTSLDEHFNNLSSQNGNEESSTDTVKFFESLFNPIKSGETVELENHHINIVIPSGYIFLTSGEAKAYDYYINNEGYEESFSKNIIGILIKGDTVTSGEASTTIINYMYYFPDEGYISDKDASSVNTEQFSSDMLNSLKENGEKAGQSNFKFLIKPSYSPEFHSYKYAVSFDAEGSDGTYTTYNNDLVLLNRHGYILNILALDKDYKGNVDNDIETIRKAIQVTPGHTYMDYDNDKDKVSAMTLGGLALGVAGAKVAAKIGLIALLLKFWKLVILAGVFILANFKKVYNKVRGMFGKDKTESENNTEETK